MSKPKQCAGVLPGQTVFDDLVPEVKRLSEEVPEVRAFGLAQAGVERGHAVYRSDGLPHTAGHQTLLDRRAAGQTRLRTLPLLSAHSRLGGRESGFF